MKRILSWPFIAAVAVALVLIVLAPFVISGNQPAQVLLGILVSALSTGIGVAATRAYAEDSHKNELTRYGLQAWRTIDSLGIKIAQQSQAGAAGPEMLEQWLLDVDQAKWAWQDLLREVFELQARLQLETDEVAAKYKKRISEASDEVSKAVLEDERRLELARIKTKAPLPLMSAEAVDCPECQAKNEVSVGTSPGASRWPSCSSCGCVFPVHRASDGSVTVNANARRLLVRIGCPVCDGENAWNVTAEHDVRFLRACAHCKALLQFEGSSREPRVSVAAPLEHDNAAG